MFDIEALVEEQKKTQEAIKLLRESGNYDELLKKIPEEELDWREKASLHINVWDYDSSSRTYDMQAAYYIREAVKSFGKAKDCLGAVKRHYEGQIKGWEDFREKCKSLAGKNKHRGDWKKMYSNPVCLKFFEDYERANGIESSIYKEAYGGEE